MYALATLKTWLGRIAQVTTQRKTNSTKSQIFQQRLACVGRPTMDV